MLTYADVCCCILSYDDVCPPGAVGLRAETVGGVCEWGAGGPGSACGGACANTYGAAGVVYRRGVLVNIRRTVQVDFCTQ